MGTTNQGDLEAEATGWREIDRLIRRLTVAERLQPGFYREPDWSVRDLAAHLGTWLAEAHVQFQRLRAGTYGGHDVDVDGLNAALLAAMHDQPWDVVWTQANAARTMLLDDWPTLPDADQEVAWWVAKACAPHYAEHLPRLRAWVDESGGQRA